MCTCSDSVNHRCYRGGCVGRGPTNPRRPCPPRQHVRNGRSGGWGRRKPAQCISCWGEHRGCAADHLSMCYSSRPTDWRLMLGLRKNKPAYPADMVAAELLMLDIGVDETGLLFYKVRAGQSSPRKGSIPCQALASRALLGIGTNMGSAEPGSAASGWNDGRRQW